MVGVKLIFGNQLVASARRTTIEAIIYMTMINLMSRRLGQKYPFEDTLLMQTPDDPADRVRAARRCWTMLTFQPSQTANTVTTTNSVRKLNRNQRRLGVGVMAFAVEIAGNIKGPPRWLRSIRLCPTPAPSFRLGDQGRATYRRVATTTHLMSASGNRFWALSIMLLPQLSARNTKSSFGFSCSPNAHSTNRSCLWRCGDLCAIPLNVVTLSGSAGSEKQPALGGGAR